jgi:hypothetical protein
MCAQGRHGVPLPTATTRIRSPSLIWRQRIPEAPPILEAPPASLRWRSPAGIAGTTAYELRGWNPRPYEDFGFANCRA